MLEIQTQPASEVDDITSYETISSHEDLSGVQLVQNVFEGASRSKYSGVEPNQIARAVDDHRYHMECAKKFGKSGLIELLYSRKSMKPRALHIFLLNKR